MKVLQVLWSTNVNSGVANVIMNYYRNIDRKKVQFDFLVLSLPSNSFNNEINQLGGQVYKFTVPGIKTYFRAKKDLNEFFKAHGKEYDIIHCHEILTAKLVFKYARKYGNVKCISHSHNTKLSEKPIRAIRNRLVVSGLTKASDYCFACGRLAAQNAFGKKITSNKKYMTLFNAIDLSKYEYSEDARQSIRNEFGIDDKFVLGNVGRFCKQKNQIFAVKVLQEVLKRRDDAVLMLVGDGVDRGMLTEYVKENNLQDRVIFTGLRKDISSILSAMDYFVFPSIFEGLPVSLVEAQANGLKSIYFDTLTNEVNLLDTISVMNKSSSPSEWADVIATDEKTVERNLCCEQVGNAGFEITIQAKKLEDKYKEILDSQSEA